MYSGGTGTYSNPYLISTTEDLYDVRYNLDKYFLQINDIDLSVYENWEPIGDNINPFLGRYKGGSFLIENLTINRPDQNYIGLFGYVKQQLNINFVIITEGAVDDVRLRDVNVIGQNYVGSLIGSHQIITPSNISTYTVPNDGVLSGTVQGNSNVGGLIGRLDGNGNYGIERCFSSADVYCTGSDLSGRASAGGLIGNVSSWTKDIKRCFSDGNVTHTGTSGSYVGGLIGSFSDVISTSYSIANSYSRGEIFGRNHVGGLVGYGNIIEIINCYAEGKVSAVTDNYAAFISNVTSLDISGCYYDSDVSESFDSYAIGKTTIQMKTQTTFEDWDFDTTWGTWGINPNINDGYPYLQWAVPPVSDIEVYVITDTGLQKAQSMYVITESGLREIEKTNIITDFGLR